MDVSVMERPRVDLLNLIKNLCYFSSLENVKNFRTFTTFKIKINPAKLNKKLQFS